jgi:hypothetical protein
MVPVLTTVPASSFTPSELVISPLLVISPALSTTATELKPDDRMVPRLVTVPVPWKIKMPKPLAPARITPDAWLITLPDPSTRTRGSGSNGTESAVQRGRGGRQLSWWFGRSLPATFDPVLGGAS